MAKKKQRRLSRTVYVEGVAYGPDDEVPPEVAEQIGDHAWEESSGDDDDEEEMVLPDDDYDELKTDELWKLLRERSIGDVPSSARKAELVQALRNWDDAQ